MIIQHPVISGTDTSTCQPSFISVFFQPGEYTERRFFPSDIELCPIEVSTPEKAVKLLASPIFIFWLYQPIAVHIFLFPFPWSQTAGQFNCTFISYGIGDSGFESPSIAGSAFTLTATLCERQWSQPTDKNRNKSKKYFIVSVC